jgi:hypothetical protein
VRIIAANRILKGSIKCDPYVVDQRSRDETAPG